MSDHRKRLGQKGEEAATRFLQNKGYRILFRNYRQRFGEIDIICEMDGTIIFVEVRSKRSLRFGSGAESVIMLKQQRIRQVAQSYLQQKGLHHCKIRFDVIDILFNPEPQITHIEHAF